MPGKLQQLGRLYRTAKHFRASQIAWRLWYVAERRLHNSFKRVWPRPSERALPPSSSLPKALFGPRNHLTLVGGHSVRLLLQGLNEPLKCPMNWTFEHTGERAHLGLLNLHYMEYLESLPDEICVEVIEDWIANNPSDGHGAWDAAWHPYALSIRVVVWMQLIAERRERLDPAFIDRMRCSLGAQVRHLYRHMELDLGGNHLIKNIKALLWAAAFFKGKEPERWCSRARGHLYTALGDQVLADGMHFELSPAYHCQVFADLLECSQLLSAGATQSLLPAALHKMAQVIADLTHPDGYTSLFGDSGMHMAYSPGECLRVYTQVSERHIVANEEIYLTSAGYYGLRSDDDFMLVDCGQLAADHLPAHGHGDALSFEWSVGGHRIVVDPGVMKYEAGEWRKWSRSTRAHNTLTLDNEDQGEFWSSFRLGRRARVARPVLSRVRSGFRISSGHDGFSHLPGRPVHRRSFTITPGRIEISDFVDGGQGQRARSRILLHPDVEIVFRDGDLFLDLEDVHLRLSTEAQVSITKSWWCPDFCTRLPTHQVVLDYGPAPCNGSFSMAREQVIVDEEFFPSDFRALDASTMD